jgi:hypothetical protein
LISYSRIQGCGSEGTRIDRLEVAADKIHAPSALQYLLDRGYRIAKFRQTTEDQFEMTGERPNRQGKDFEDATWPPA